MERKLIVLAVLIAILNYSCAAPRKGVEREPLFSLEVMTYNVGDLNGHRPNLDDVIRIIKKNGLPDLLFLQEIAGGNQASGLAESLGMQHYVYRDNRGRGYGQAIMSGYPLVRPDIYYFKASKKGYGVVAADLLVNGRKVLVCSLHLDRIDRISSKTDRVDVSWITALGLLMREVMEETVRSRSVEELLTWIQSRQPQSVIIGGDFNTVPMSKGIRAMGRVFDDAMRSSSVDISGTYKKSSLPVEPRIDFIFHSRNMKCSDASVIRESAGDHYPVRAGLEARRLPRLNSPSVDRGHSLVKK